MQILVFGPVRQSERILLHILARFFGNRSFRLEPQLPSVSIDSVWQSTKNSARLEASCNSFSSWKMKNSNDNESTEAEIAYEKKPRNSFRYYLRARRGCTLMAIYSIPRLIGRLQFTLSPDGFNNRSDRVNICKFILSAVSIKLYIRNMLSNQQYRYSDGSCTRRLFSNPKTTSVIDRPRRRLRPPRSNLNAINTFSRFGNSLINMHSDWWVHQSVRVHVYDGRPGGTRDRRFWTTPIRDTNTDFTNWTSNSVHGM